MFNLILKGGPIMWLLFGCSILSLTIIMERSYMFSKTKSVKELEKRIDILGIIAHTAPLLGLLGTVTGMIRAFMVIESASGRVNPQLLAGGIWEALLTTAFGLMIAIPSFIAYHIFNNKLDKYCDLEE